MRPITLAAFALGFSSGLCQLVLLREFLSVFFGVELVIGAAVGSWLFLNACGALLGCRIHRNISIFALAASTAVLSVIPPLAVLGLRLLRSSALTGLEFGLGEVFLSALALLLPFCTLSGFLLAGCAGLAQTQAESKGGASAGAAAVYVADTAGGILSAFVYGAFFVSAPSPFFILSWADGLLIACSAVLFLCAGRERDQAAGAWKLLRPAALLLCCSWLVLSLRLDAYSRAWLYPGQEVFLSVSTPVGQFVAARRLNEVTVFQDGVPAGGSGETAAAEELVHYTLLQPDAVKRILIVSGGTMGTISEALKYPGSRIDYLEPDASLFKLLAIAGHPPDSRTSLIAADPRRHMGESGPVYDAVILGTGDPVSSEVNRYYTAEAFRTAKSALRKGGVLGMSLSTSAHHASPELRRLASSIFTALCGEFAHCLSLPGSRLFFLASDAPLSPPAPGDLEKRGIRSSHLNNNYLAAMLTPDSLREAAKAVSMAAPVNLDLRPVSSFIHLELWLARQGQSSAAPLAFAALLMLALGAMIIVPGPRPLKAAVSSTGLTGMALQLILIAVYQARWGGLYREMAFIFGAFLCGTACGGLAGKQWKAGSRQKTLIADWSLAVSGLLLPLSFSAGISPAAAAWLFPAVNAWFGFAAGLQFTAAVACFRAPQAGFAILYSLDMAAASLGALAAGAYLLPVAGAVPAAFALGGLKLISAVLLSWRGEGLQRTGSSELQHTVPASVIRAALVVLVPCALIGLLQSDAVNYAMHNLSFRPEYRWLVIGVLAWGVARAVRAAGGQTASSTRLAIIDNACKRAAGWNAFRLISYFVFSLAVFYPLARCYFLVPFVFCRVCPRRCIFGFLRPYLVPAALLINAERLLWCHHSCPIGLTHDGQFPSKNRPRFLSRKVQWGAFAALLWTAYAFWQSGFSGQPGTGRLYQALSTNLYVMQTPAAAAALVLLVLGFFFRRPFCSLLCPIGALSRVAARAATRLSAANQNGALKRAVVEPERMI